ncbi:MAG TPA: alpha/beta hydrolase, partial [Deferrisomatales bacterium]|nr:alpha/beta hydrolase [Deferrisomatales bacterium]
MRSSPGSVAALATLLLCVTLLGGCSRLVDTLFLSPEQGSMQSPGALGLEYEELQFPAADGTALHGWWLPGAAGQPTVVLLHDGTGNIGARVDLLRQFHDWLGVGILIFDYRGFGRSAGTGSDPGMAADVAGARQLAHARGWDRRGLVLYGRGLGAALAANSAASAPADGVVLEAVFPDMERLQRARHPLLASLLAPWLTGRFDTLKAVAALRVPALFLHGDRDQQVPIGLGWQVYDACKAPKRFRTIP